MRQRFVAQRRGGTGIPVVLLHGFMDTCRTWDLVCPLLERDHDVLAPTMVGHAGGAVAEDLTRDTLAADDIERVMDDAGFETAHLVGNSLGGYVAMHLAERGRARSVTALAPAGGWPVGDASYDHAVRLFRRMQRNLVVGAPLAGLVSRTRLGRRYALRDVTTHHRHVPRELVVHMARGARACSVGRALLEMSDDVTWHVDPARIDCPVRIVWGTADRVLLHPAAGASYRTWFPDAEWIELDGIGHCPQLDVPDTVAGLVREHVGASERHLGQRAGTAHDRG